MNKLTEIEQVTLPVGYVKTSDGTKFSPITSVKSVINEKGETIDNIINNIADRIDNIIGDGDESVSLPEIEQSIDQLDKDKISSTGDSTIDGKLTVTGGIETTVVTQNGKTLDNTYSKLDHIHDDRYYTETEIDTKLSGKSNSNHDHDGRYFTEAEINTKLGGYSVTSHNHNGTYYTETEVNNLLAGKAASSHTHDDRYYTESEVNNKLNGKANTSHGNHVPATQTASNSKFLRNDNTWQTVTPGNIGAATSSHTHTPASIGAAASSHTHDDRYYTESEMNTKLNAKANTSHSHTKSDIGLGNVNNWTATSSLTDSSSSKYATASAIKLLNDKIEKLEANSTIYCTESSSVKHSYSGVYTVPSDYVATDSGAGGTYGIIRKVEDTIWTPILHGKFRIYVSTIFQSGQVRSTGYGNMYGVPTNSFQTLIGVISFENLAYNSSHISLPKNSIIHNGAAVPTLLSDHCYDALLKIEANTKTGNNYISNTAYYENTYGINPTSAYVSLSNISSVGYKTFTANAEKVGIIPYQLISSKAYNGYSGIKAGSKIEYRINICYDILEG